MGVPETGTNARTTNTDGDKQEVSGEEQTAGKELTQHEELRNEEENRKDLDRNRDGERPNTVEATTEAIPAHQTDNEKAPAQADVGKVEEEPEDESKYLSGFKLGILSLGLCLTTFVIALDNTIIATVSKLSCTKWMRLSRARKGFSSAQNRTHMLENLA